MTLFLTVCIPAMAADDPANDASAGASKAEDCTACHNSPISLNGRGVDTIAEQIIAIRAGDQKHPPGLGELSEEDIVDIAAYLDNL
jgi:cytochrome c553